MWITQKCQLGHWNMKYLQKVVLLCPRNLLSMVNSKAGFNFSRSFLILLSRLAWPQEKHVRDVFISPVSRGEKLLFSVLLWRCFAHTTRPVGDSEAVARWHPSDPEGLSSPGGPIDCCGSQDGLSRNHHARLGEMLFLFLFFFKNRNLSNLS